MASGLRCRKPGVLGVVLAARLRLSQAGRLHDGINRQRFGFLQRKTSPLFSLHLFFSSVFFSPLRIFFIPGGISLTTGITASTIHSPIRSGVAQDQVARADALTVLVPVLASLGRHGC